MREQSAEPATPLAAMPLEPEGGPAVLMAVVGLGDAVSGTQGRRKASNENKRQVYG
jgi:hypothetical protein